MSKLSFQTFCIEFYSHHIGMSSNEVFYMSNTGVLLADDETGLYGQSPLYIFGLYLEEMKHKKDKKRE